MSDLNLPPAPDGHFWRVSSVLGLPKVNLRKHVWFFSVEVDAIIPLGMDSDKEAVEWAAQEILDRIAARAERRSFMSRNGGDQ